MRGYSYCVVAGIIQTVMDVHGCPLKGKLLAYMPGQMVSEQLSLTKHSASSAVMVDMLDRADFTMWCSVQPARLTIPVCVDVL